mgnify:CR=1 FL=1
MNTQPALMKINQNFQVTIPSSIRKEYDIKPGDFVEAKNTKQGIVLKPKVLLDKMLEVDLSPKWQKMLQASLEELDRGEYKEFTSVDSLIKDLRNAS